MGGMQPSSTVRIVSVPARVPASVERLDVLVDDVPVGDLLRRVCELCEVAVIEHVRIDPPYRRKGLARLLVHAATVDYPCYSWSTTVIANHPGAQGFAQAGLWPGPPSPRWCKHMREADEMVP